LLQDRFQLPSREVDLHVWAKFSRRMMARVDGSSPAVLPMLISRTRSARLPRSLGKTSSESFLNFEGFWKKMGNGDGKHP
jgi:hypothetical protein